MSNNFIRRLENLSRVYFDARIQVVIKFDFPSNVLKMLINKIHLFAEARTVNLSMLLTFLCNKHNPRHKQEVNLSALLEAHHNDVIIKLNDSVVMVMCST